jgi:hypothetical protein
MRIRALLTGVAVLFLVTGAALALASIEAHALADGPACAMVRQTPDGFLNLRANFSMSGKIIAKLRPGDRLYVTGTELGINTLGDWVEVHGVWRLDSNDISKPWHSGWVARRFIREQHGDQRTMHANDKLPENMLGRWCHVSDLSTKAQTVYFRPSFVGGEHCTDFNDGITLSQEGFSDDRPIDQCNWYVFDKIERTEKDVYRVFARCDEAEEAFDLDKDDLGGMQQLQLQTINDNEMLFVRRMPEG